jgi:hypothetical protein
MLSTIAPIAAPALSSLVLFTISLMPFGRLRDRRVALV